ncbi:hypothetical protein AMATHDRAFT_7598 [Amanita thiersii Skay4041]|uniref:Uncharacterized protein n=1 Tax=Amanita thiersii Skay4041 TaxID=703135 RepID=A0A2A9N9E7_9AGAR|nr:hypothetical protein AMATHDRAFT_7598 [Amanita thiersii Skay4041]
MSDLYYPDNPSRRVRAAQLKEDIEFFCEQFYELEEKRDDLLKEIKLKLNALMKKYSYNTTDELEKGVQKTLKGTALEEYNKFKELVEGADEVIVAVFQITGIIGVATGIFLGAVVTLGFMTGGAALLSLGMVTGVLGAVAVTAILFTVFEGTVERDNMQKAIRDLSYERVKARSCYEAMNALANWLYSIKLWLDEPLISDNEALMKKKLESDFAVEYDKSKRTTVIPFLENYDQERGAWTNEDPDWKSGEEDIIASMSEASKSAPESRAKRSAPDAEKAGVIAFDYSSADGSGSLQLTYVTSDETSCTGKDKDGNTWVIRYESGSTADRSAPRISDYLFTLENVKAKNVYKGCKLTFSSRPSA